MLMELQSNPYFMYGVWFLCLVTAVWFITKRWFWSMLFGIGAFASLLATLYFFTNAQMQSAVLCVVLTAILGMIYLKLLDKR